MKPTWIVEKHMFPEYENELAAAIKGSGAELYMFDDTDFMKFNFDNDIKAKFSNEDCTIFYGSLQRGRELYAKTDFVPGIFLTIDNYECYKYYGLFGGYLLNSRYHMMGLNDLKRWKNLFELELAQDEKIFIRPSNGFKTFPGQVINMNKFNEEYETLIKSYGGLDMSQLVVVSPYRNVVRESRFAVVNGKIIDGCVYMVDGEKITERLTDSLALDYANSILPFLPPEYPDPAFTLDIAYVDDTKFAGPKGYRVIEVNSLCCAGLYQMDKKLIVEAMNELVLEKHKDFWEG
jgi:hypothetical protein